jgi:hypothetical protein
MLQYVCQSNADPRIKQGKIWAIAKIFYPSDRRELVVIQRLAWWAEGDVLVSLPVNLAIESLREFA